jgi:uncharacterized protein YegJ (DUF2314 family)
MGNFSKRFKFMNRHKQADFSREQTLAHWKRELVDLMIRSGMVTFKKDEDEEDKNVSEHTD